MWYSASKSSSIAQFADSWRLLPASVVVIRASCGRDKTAWLPGKNNHHHSIVYEHGKVNRVRIQTEVFSKPMLSEPRRSPGLVTRGEHLDTLTPRFFNILKNLPAQPTYIHITERVHPKVNDRETLGPFALCDKVRPESI